MPCFHHSPSWVSLPAKILFFISPFPASKPSFCPCYHSGSTQHTPFVCVSSLSSNTFISRYLTPFAVSNCCEMADAAFGVVGVVGVALQCSLSLHGFISSIKGADRSMRSLNSHIETLKDVLQPLHDRISLQEVRTHPLNAPFMKGLEKAVRCCQERLRELESGLRRCMKQSTDSVGKLRLTSRLWWRRIRFVLRKEDVVQRQNALFGSLSILGLALSPVNM